MRDADGIDPRQKLLQAWEASTVRTTVVQPLHDDLTEFGVLSRVALTGGLLVWLLGAFLTSYVAITLGITIAVATILGFEYLRTDDVLSPIFLVWGFFGYFYLASYVATVTFARNFYDTPDIAAVAAAGISIQFAGFLALTLAYYSRFAPQTAAYLTMRWPDQQAVSRAVWRRIATATLLVGITAFAVFVSLNGGVVRLLTASALNQYATTLNTQRYWILVNITVFSGVALYMAAAESKRHQILSLGFVLVFAAVFAAAHTRKRVLGLAVIGLVLYHYHHREITLRQAVAAAVLGIAFISLFNPIENLFQGGLGAAVTYVQEVGLEFLVYPIVFQTQILIFEHVPGTIDYQWGAVWLHLPIGETAWTAQHGVDAGAITDTLAYGYDRPGHELVPGGVGELYLNFGLPGVLGGMLVFGAVIRFAYKAFQQKRESVVVSAVYAMFYYYVAMVLFDSFLPYEFLMISALAVGLGIANFEWRSIVGDWDRY